jgi:LPS sulfotransferase NodH
MPRFKRFVMLANMRTGSNFLEANLNAMEGITCHGEAFNPHFIGKKDQIEACGITLDARESDPARLIRTLESSAPGLHGFRLFHDHDARVLDMMLADPACAKIVLTRNPLESYVSLGIARATGQWKMGDARKRREGLARFDAHDFATHVEDLHAFQRRILHALQSTGQTAFYIDYDDIGDIGVLNGLAAWLGSPTRLEAPVDTVKKQNPEPLSDLLENPGDVAPGLALLDRFNLTRTPNFEPRRGPALASWSAATGARLLYLPLRGGPETGVTTWLAQASEGRAPGLVEGFTQKALRDWQEANPGFRAFTVLRHPLPRAWAAFCLRILPGETRDIRNRLKNGWGAPIPAPERVDRMTNDDLREAFTIFLRFLRANVNGQTSLRVDPFWASQSAVLQGFAAIQHLDMVLREDRLAQGLAFLAAETGATVSPYAPDPAPPGLPDIWTPEMEDLSRDAYARDYAAFGFGPWQTN